MAKFRRKSIEVEAEQWFPNKPLEEVVFPLPGIYQCLNRDTTGLWRNGSEHDDTLFIHAGDWIATDKDGVQTLYRDWEFEAEYEPLEKK